MIFFVFDSNRNINSIADKNGFGKTKPFISIGHRNFVYHVGSKTNCNGKDECAMSHSLFKWLGLAPLFIHMMWEKIAGLASMNDNIGFSDRTPGCGAFVIQFKVLKILLNKHG